MEKFSSEKGGLPDDLILERILPLLPIKPLTQCKVLSKHYNSIISSPNFILKHTKQPLFNHPGTPLQTLFIQSGNTFYLYSCPNDDNVADFNDGDCYNNKNNLVKLDLDFKVDVGHGSMTLVGSSNGLVCLGEMHGKCFMLYNPTTNESHKYYPGDSGLIGNSRPLAYWGFGYVSSIDDYKVVRVMMRWNGNTSTIHVFSRNTNTWKLIGYNLVGRHLWREAKLVVNSETLYWFQPMDRTTITFDLVSETFRSYDEVAVPTLISHGPLIQHKMGRDYTMGDCLCLMGGCISKCASDSENVVMIDVYNRFDRMENFTFNCNMFVDCANEFIGFTNTGKVFVAHYEDATLGLFDPNSKRILVRFQAKGIRNRIHIQSYVQSEVSPLPSAEGPSSSPEGTWATNLVDSPPSNFNVINSNFNAINY